MTHYRTRFDAIFGFVLLLGLLACILILSATAFYYFTHFRYGVSPTLLLFSSPFAILIATVLLLRRQVLRGSYARWAYLLTILSALVALLVAFSWFQDPMHDIGLWFGSHGRWGCRTVHSATDFRPYFTIRDDTVPWILFAPVVVATVMHWRYGARRGLRNPQT